MKQRRRAFWLMILIGLSLCWGVMPEGQMDHPPLRPSRQPSVAGTFP